MIQRILLIVLAGSMALVAQAQQLATAPSGNLLITEIATGHASLPQQLPPAHPQSALRAVNLVLSGPATLVFPHDFAVSLVYNDDAGVEQVLPVSAFAEVEAAAGEFRSDLVVLPPTVQTYHWRWTALPGDPALRVQTRWFDPGVLPAVAAPSPAPLPSARGNCGAPLPGYVTRTGWNCPSGQEITRGPASFTTVTHLIVHHSAGVNTSTNWAQVVLAIWNFHVNSNGWADVGYNWLIDPNGIIYEGRGGGDNVVGAHFCGRNTNTMGVCMLGNFNTVEATTAAFNSLATILAWKACANQLDPQQTALHNASGLQLLRVSGHRDGCATECPGENLYRVLPQVRSAVARRLDVSTSVTSAPNRATNLQLSPNPATVGSGVWISSNAPEATVGALQLIDANGRLLAQFPLELPAGDHRWLLPTAQLSPGIYRLHWQPQQGTPQTLGLVLH